MKLIKYTSAFLFAIVLLLPACAPYCPPGEECGKADLSTESSATAKLT